MRSVLASFVLGLRAPFRSRLVAAMLVLLGATILLLPTHLQSDGTSEGMLRMVLSWTLGPVSVLLGVSTLWAACSSISGEIEGKRFLGTAISPAGRFAVCLGRWLGLVALDAALLFVALTGVYLQARHNVPDSKARAVRRLVEMDPVGLEAETDRIFAYAFPNGVESDRVPGIRAAIRADLEGSTHLQIGPGQERHWIFPMEDPHTADADLSFHYLSSYGSAQGIRGTLTVLNQTGGTIAEIELTNDDHGTCGVMLDDKDLADVTRLEVVFKNLENEDTGAAILVNHVSAIRLTVPGGGLGMNLVRTGWSLLAVFALLAALGLASGCAFSFPVAAFVATGLCAMVLASGNSVYTDTATVAAHEHGHGPQGAFSRRVESFSRHVSSGFNAVTAPIAETRALDRLGDGLAISGKSVMAAVVLDGIAVPLVLLFLGAVALRRREFP